MKKVIRGGDVSFKYEQIQKIGEDVILVNLN